MDQESGPEGLPRPPQSQWATTRLSEERLEPTARQTLWFRVLGWVMMMLGFAYILYVAPSAIAPDERVFGTMKGLGLVVLSQLALISLCSRLEDTVYPDGDAVELVRSAPGDATVAVRASLYQKDVLTGADHGWTWLEGGALHFHGMGSDFRVTREMVPPIGMWPGGHPPKHDILNGIVALPIPAEPLDICIRLEALQPYSSQEARQRALKFSKALRQWYAHHTPSETGPLLPPTTLHPALTTSRLFPHEASVLSLAMGLVHLTLIAYSLREIGAAEVHTLSYGVTLIVAGSMLALVWRFHQATLRVRMVRGLVREPSE